MRSVACGAVTAAPRILVVGAGGIGGTIAGYLARSWRDVTVVDAWDRHVESIRRKGLRIVAPGGTFTLRMRAYTPDDLPAEAGPFDVLIVAVKAYDTMAALECAAPRLGAAATVLCAQNGITELAASRVVTADRIVGCVVTLAAEFSQPGTVHRTSPEGWPVLTIGALRGRGGSDLHALADLLAPVGEIRISSDILAELWSKLARNAMTNGIAALTGATTRVLWSDARFLPVVIDAAAETVAVARADGVDVPPIAGVAPAPLLLAARDGDPSAMREVAHRLRAFAYERTAERDHAPSMLQDARKGRRTEVDEINGWVAERGRAVEVATPVNTAIVENVHRLERGELRIHPDNIELLRPGTAGGPGG